MRHDAVGSVGGGVWSSPTVDVKRKVVYAATGNMYTEPQQPTSDAVMAFDLDTGAVKWTAQVTAKDIFIIGCGGSRAWFQRERLRPIVRRPKTSVRISISATAPMLVKAPGGKDIIVAGQKSGVGWAFDPDKNGAVLWQYRAGKGSALGGLEFGSAVDAEQAYFAVSDMIGGSRAVCTRSSSRPASVRGSLRRRRRNAAPAAAATTPSSRRSP